jgi:hypothetical protein
MIRKLMASATNGSFGPKRTAYWLSISIKAATGGLHGNAAGNHNSRQRRDSFHDLWYFHDRRSGRERLL